MSQNQEEDAQLDLRSARAATALGDFCFAWLDAGREIAFGSARVALRTADDLTAASCSSARQRATRRRHSEHD